MIRRDARQSGGKRALTLAHETHERHETRIGPSDVRVFCVLSGVSPGRGQLIVRLRRYLRVMFAVDDINDTLERLRRCGAQLVGKVVAYEDVYRLYYICGPEKLFVGLAQELG